MTTPFLLKQEARSKKQEARSKKQEARSKKIISSYAIIVNTRSHIVDNIDQNHANLRSWDTMPEHLVVPTISIYVILH